MWVPWCCSNISIAIPADVRLLAAPPEIEETNLYFSNWNSRFVKKKKSLRCESQWEERPRVTRVRTFIRTSSSFLYQKWGRTEEKSLSSLITVKNLDNFCYYDVLRTDRPLVLVLFLTRTSLPLIRKSIGIMTEFTACWKFRTSGTFLMFKNVT